MKKMHLSKRLFTIVMVFVMLSAGSLTYFAFAEDAEPCGVVTHCPECGIGTCTDGNYLGYDNTESQLTNHEMADGTKCYYELQQHQYGLMCDECTYTYTTETRMYEKGHNKCGAKDGYR